MSKFVTVMIEELAMNDQQWSDLARRLLEAERKTDEAARKKRKKTDEAEV